MTAAPLPVVALISGNGSNLQALLDACSAGELPVTVRAVISNRADAYGLERARRHGVATDVLDHRTFDSREAYDVALVERIRTWDPGLVVLAGFMRILSDSLVTSFQGRMLNIHPSLLPAYKGLHTHARALEAGDAEHGCSVHFVTPALDAGPVVARGVVPVHADDDEDSLARRVQVQEHRIYPLVVRWFAQGRLQLDQGGVHLDGKPLPAPVEVRADDPLPG
ncbi:MAG: phosphoribosylglycinamide formyltransferase [Ectothiorhodospiraceae bacterium]